MTPLAHTLGWLAVQVTVVASLALVLDALLARRCPASAAKLLDGTMLLLVLLTAVAFCPLPGWWTCSPPPVPVDLSIDAAEAGDSQEAAPPFSFRLPPLPFARDAPAPSRGVVAPETLLVSTWLGGALVFGLALALGLIHLARLRRLGRPLVDESLTRDAQSLARALGIRRRVELREADCPDLPATAGWLRPVILLPPDWPTWDDGDRRAVLAHELAHVRRGDFLSGLLALTCRALHFYHPVLRWLIARLRLRQEVAADALAASVAGGRDTYLRALARLALRSERRPLGRPAGLLLSVRGGVLLRRIAMLRNEKVARPLSRLARAAAFGTLVLVAMLTSSLRGPVDAKPASPSAEVEPFDLSYVCTDDKPKVHGVVAIRPAALLAQPGMAALETLYLGLLKLELEKEGRSLPDFNLRDVEQVVADVHLSSQGTGKPNSRSLVVGASGMMIRMKKEVDWEKVVRALCPDVKVKEEDGVQVIQVTAPALGPTPMTFHAPDRRTLVMGAGGFDQKPADVLKRGKPRVLGAGWKQVERADLAYAFDNRDGHYTKTFTTDVKDHPEVQAVLKQFQGLAVGVNFRDGIHGHLFLDAKDEAAARSLHEAVKEAFGVARREAQAELAANKDLPAAQRAWLRMVDDVIGKGTLSATGTQVKASSDVKFSLADLFGKAK